MPTIAQRVFVENFEEQIRIDTVSEELNLRIFLYDDEGTDIYVYVSDVEPCEDRENVKYFPLRGVSGSGVIDISAYAREFFIAVIVFELTSGNATTVKAGWTANSQTALRQTDVSFLNVYDPLPISVNIPPPNTATELHFTLPSGVFNIDVVMIRYKYNG